jgi:hypothetical protein
MTFKRFSKLWDTFVTNRPKASNQTPLAEHKMNEATSTALIEYANGDKSKINAVRKKLNRRRDA